MGLATKFELHPNQISQWKIEFIDRSKDLFNDKRGSGEVAKDDSEKLYTKIGRLEMERDFLKKNLTKLERYQ